MHNIRTGDSELIRELNENLVLRSLMRHQPISRVELSEVTNLSFPTITKIINEFKEREFILEHSIGGSTGGRRPTLLKINPHGGFVVGIKLDVIETFIGLLDLEGNVKKIVKIPTEMGRKDSKETLEIIVNAVKTLIDEFHADTGFKERILGIGVSVGGKIDYKEGIVVENSVLGWRDVPIRAIIKNSLGLETYIEDHPRVMAIGEHWFGNAKDVNNIVWIYIGTAGLGIGVVINGSIYSGTSGNAGKFYHVPVVENGPVCNCGKRGCLETLVGEVPILKRVQEAIEKGIETDISNLLRNNGELKMSHIFQCAKSGDNFAKDILEKMAYYTSLTVSIVMAACDPGAIIIGGPAIEEGGDELFELIKAGIQDNVIKEERFLQSRIKRSILGENAPVTGAATLVYQELFKLSQVYV